MNVITGATGAVGRPFGAYLKDRGVTVRAVTRSGENSGHYIQKDRGPALATVIAEFIRSTTAAEMTR